MVTYRTLYQEQQWVQCREPEDLTCPGQEAFLLAHNYQSEACLSSNLSTVKTQWNCKPPHSITDCLAIHSKAGVEKVPRAVKETKHVKGAKSLVALTVVPCEHSWAQRAFPGHPCRLLLQGSSSSGWCPSWRLLSPREWDQGAPSALHPTMSYNLKKMMMVWEHWNHPHVHCDRQQSYSCMKTFLNLCVVKLPPPCFC